MMGLNAAIRLVLLLGSCTVLESFTVLSAQPSTAYLGRLHHLAPNENSARCLDEHNTGVLRFVHAGRSVLPILRSSSRNSESGWEKEMQEFFQASPLDFNGTAMQGSSEPEPEHISEVFARSPLCAPSEGGTILQLSEENAKLKAALEASRAETAALKTEVRRLELELDSGQLSLEEEMAGLFSASAESTRASDARKPVEADAPDKVLDGDVIPWDKEVGWEEEMLELFASNPLTSGKRYSEEGKTSASEEEDLTSRAADSGSEEVQFDREVKWEDEILQIFDANPLTSGRRYREEEEEKEQEDGGSPPDREGKEGRGEGERF